MIAGLGKSGVSAAKLALSRGMEVYACDRKRSSQWNVKGETIPSGVEAAFESDGFEFLNRTAGVVVSPGISFKSDFVEKALSEGKEVMSEIEFASRFVNVPLIAITGTNGKTTVTRLVTEMLCKDGMDAREAGNIGTPLSDIAINHFSGDFVVCEISSFQLELVSKFKPFVALVLNLTPDHLDRYSSLEEYMQTKARIFENQEAGDFAVINGDDALIRETIPNLKSEVFIYSRTKPQKNGAYVKDGKIIFSRNEKEMEIIPVSEIRMKGVHNFENALAGICCAMLAGAGEKSIAKVLSEFVPPLHRMEEVAKINDILFINDSKATNVDALKRALQSFTGKLVLIAGGRDKKGDFDSIRDDVASSVRIIIAIGEAGDKIEHSFSDVVQVVREKTLRDAVLNAYNIAVPGETVILSPGCASFDMFESFEHRGEEFKKYVKELYGNTGER